MRYSVKVFAVRCDEKGRRLPTPEGKKPYVAQDRVHVEAQGHDAAKAAARAELSKGRGRVISINFESDTALVAYVESSK